MKFHTPPPPSQRGFASAFPFSRETRGGILAVFNKKTYKGMFLNQASSTRFVEAPIANHKGARCPSSGVASLLVLPPPPKCTDNIKRFTTCDLYAQASASEKNFSGLKILVTSAINVVPFYYLWYGAINDSIPTTRKH